MNERREPIILLLKARIPGGAMGDLFDEKVQVQGHTTKTGTVVKPHMATRHKRRERPPMAAEEAERIAGQVIAWQSKRPKGHPLTSYAAMIGGWAHATRSKVHMDDEGAIIDAMGRQLRGQAPKPATQMEGLAPHTPQAANAPKPAPSPAPAGFSHAAPTGHAIGGYHAIDTNGEIMRGPKWKPGEMSPRFTTEEAAEAFGRKLDRGAKPAPSPAPAPAGSLAGIAKMAKEHADRKRAAEPPEKPEWQTEMKDIHPAYRNRLYHHLTVEDFHRQAKLAEGAFAAKDAKTPQARKAAFERAVRLHNPHAYADMHRIAVERAVKEGKQVRPEVLASYPGLGETKPAAPGGLTGDFRARIEAAIKQGTEGAVEAEVARSVLNERDPKLVAGFLRDQLNYSTRGDGRAMGREALVRLAQKIVSDGHPAARGGGQDAAAIRIYARNIVDELPLPAAPK